MDFVFMMAILLIIGNESFRSETIHALFTITRNVKQAAVRASSRRSPKSGVSQLTLNKLVLGLLLNSDQL